ncbi:5816_t:CDS:1 [Acaulospora morrowiae]|uniref:5816_t:CDS:1 n=1 Tax=Acaulospora morrowiae TaxID=94023 RepID=A0A9N9F6J3_9GLOM|nr:5816_t:CDS:1 [Acaulospora morrowiae]
MDDTFNLQFVAEAMSSLIGCRVVATESEGPALDIDLVHRYCLLEVDDNGEIVKRPRFEEYEQGCDPRRIRRDEETRRCDCLKQIFFNFSRESRSIFIALHDCSVRELRRKIQEILSIDEPLSLIYNYQTLDDSRTLESYDIQPRSTIHVISEDEDSNWLKQIFFNFSGESRSIFISLHDCSVRELRRRIREILNIDEPLSLIYDCQTLDNSRTLESYDIQPRSTIHVISEDEDSNWLKQIFFNFSGESRSIFISLHDCSVRELRRRIREILNIDEPLSLIYDCQTLDDSRTLESYDIKPRSTIQVRREDEETRRCDWLNQIFFNFSGESRSIFISLHDCSVLELRRKIQEILKIEEPLSLRFNCQTLDDSRTLKSYDIKPSSTIHVSYKLLGGFPGYYVVKESFLKPQFDYDYTYGRDYGRQRRGYERYHLPIGWKKIGLNVEKYGDNKWLGTDTDAWPISYHGTGYDAARSIAIGGFDINKGINFAYGKGVYSSPYSDEAEIYSKEFTCSLDNHRYKLMFQNRVNPTDLRKENKEKYWITASDQNIRPYALCYKRIG